jgi:thioredoxin-related protein
MRRLIAVLLLVSFGSVGQAGQIGDDGMYKESWMRDTFKDLREDLAEANAEGKRLAVIFEQRGCIYCKKMHEEVFVQPRVYSYIEENFFVVQLNLHGDLEVTDFDGEVLSEKDIARKWRILFTPSFMFLPEDIDDQLDAAQASVAVMPGAFSGGMTFDLLTWVNTKLYDTEEDGDFQRYHAKQLKIRRAAKDAN